MDTDSTTKSWCLVRWHEGYTSAKLRASGEPGVGLNVDPQTGAAFGGPLALLYEEQRAQHMRAGRFGMLGFPEPRGSLGFPKLFDDEAEAVSWIEHDGQHISIDVPTPIAVLHFSAQVYSHNDGLTRFLYDRGDLLGAASAWALYSKLTPYKSDFVTLECHPAWEKLGRYRVTKGTAEMMYLKARKMDERIQAEWSALE